MSRQPLTMQADLVRPIVTRWEAEHGPLADAPEEVRQLWTQRREHWRAFLEALPKSVPRADPTR